MRLNEINPKVLLGEESGERRLARNIMSVHAELILEKCRELEGDIPPYGAYAVESAYNQLFGYPHNGDYGLALNHWVLSLSPEGYELSSFIRNC